MEQVPTTQLYNHHNQRLCESPPLYQPVTSRQPNNSHKPPTHPTPNTQYQQHQQQPNPWRQLPLVSTPRLFPADPPLPTPRPDTSSFVFVMYTTLSVNPDSSPPQVEAARTLQSMGYPASRTDPPITHVSAVGGAGPIPVSAITPPTSAALPRPPYAPDNFARDQRQERLFNDNLIDRSQHHYQPDALHRPHEYVPQTHPFQVHDPHMQQTHSLPPQPAPLDVRHQPYPQHEYDRQIHQAQVSLPDTTALSRQPRVSAPITFRSDMSGPTTPTTPATSATQPFPAAPFSPDNNGASSNGSGTKEHVCTYPGCTKTFDRRYNLTVHFRRHTNEMPYPCKFPGCPQKFKWRSSQSHHMKTRHQARGAGRGPARTNNTMRQIRKTTGMNAYPVAIVAPLVLAESNMPPSHAPVSMGLGLPVEEEPTGTYKRAFSPRKRQMTPRQAP